MTENFGVVGNLVDDPTYAISQSGRPWLKASLAVKPWVPGQQEQPPTEYYDLVAFGAMADNILNFVGKGHRVVVNGRLELETWTGRDGQERTSKKIIVDGFGHDMRFMEAQRSTVAGTGTDAPF